MFDLGSALPRFPHSSVVGGLGSGDGFVLSSLFKSVGEFVSAGGDSVAEPADFCPNVLIYAIN